MQFNFDAAKALAVNEDGFAALDGSSPPNFMKTAMGGFGLNQHRTSSNFGLNHNGVDQSSPVHE